MSCSWPGEFHESIYRLLHYPKPYITHEQIGCILELMNQFAKHGKLQRFHFSAWPSGEMLLVWYKPVVEIRISNQIRARYYQTLASPRDTRISWPNNHDGRKQCAHLLRPYVQEKLKDETVKTRSVFINPEPVRTHSRQEKHECRHHGCTSKHCKKKHKHRRH